jgi:hypothetical protein
MQRRARTIAVALGALAALGTARAAWAVDRHERIQVTPISRGGKAGFKLKVTLRPEFYDHVRVGLGRMTAPADAKNGQFKDPRLRQLAAGDEAGYLRVRLGEHTGLAKTQPHEMEYEVIYGDGNDLTPGEKVDVVSAFHHPTLKQQIDATGKQVDYWHVFGMHDGPVNQGDTSSVMELPAPKGQ